MKRILFVLCILSFLSSGNAQTIINAERIVDGADSTYLAFGFAYNGTRGNALTDQLDLSSVFVILKKKNAYKLLGGYALLSEDGEGILRSGFAHIRHNYNLSNRIQSFEFYQIQFDDVLLIEKRELFGAGLRYNLIKKDSLKIDMELGVMQENERLNPATLNPNETLSTKFIRITAVNSLKYRLSKTVVINNILYYQPRVIDFKDYRLLNDFSLAVSLTEYFEMVTTFTMRYDSQPPSSLKSLDTSVSFGFNLKLSR